MLASIWDNISWLDWMSFVFSFATFFIALRMDLRQAELLRIIAQREARVEQKIDERITKEPSHD